MLDWQGLTCCVMASGPSLGWDDYADVALIRESGIKTITVNTTWKKAKFCDVLYGGDLAWWRHHFQDITIGAERFTFSRPVSKLYKAHLWRSKIKPAYNSGAQAIELAGCGFRASTILLLGFDGSVKHGIHHHGKHKKSANPTPVRCDQWQAQFARAAELCKHSRVINCSQYTVIECFERMPLEQAIEEFGHL